jgi:S-adenosylmethionine/arginine decarboxylase-like enzyme
MALHNAVVVDTVVVVVVSFVLVSGSSVAPLHLSHIAGHALATRLDTAQLRTFKRRQMKASAMLSQRFSPVVVAVVVFVVLKQESHLVGHKACTVGTAQL